MRSRLLLIRAGALAGALASAACNPGPGAPDVELGRTRAAVVGGYDSGPSDDAVVRLDGERGCTGTLVAPNLVVTALHCVSDLTGDGSFSCNIDGTLENPPNGLLGQPYDPASISIITGGPFAREASAYGQRILSTRATDICQKDLAFLVLDRALDDLPIAPMRLDSPVAKNERVSVLGYGLTGLPPPPDLLPERRRRDDVAVAAVGRTNDAADGVYYARPNTFALGESVCMGDSGGPALASTGALVGVYSTNVAGCEGSTARNFFTLVSQFRPLVLDAYEAAGATPWLEGQKRPGVWPDAGAPSPEPPDTERLDAGPLQTHDSAGEQPITRPASGERRVDSGFCALRPASPSPAPLRPTWPLASLMLGLLLRRRAPRR